MLSMSQQTDNINTPSYTPTPVDTVSPKRRSTCTLFSLGDGQTLLVQSTPKYCNILVFIVTNFLINSCLFPVFLPSNTCTALDRPSGFQVIEALRFQDNWHMKVVRLSALRTGRLYPQEIFLVLISVRG